MSSTAFDWGQFVQCGDKTKKKAKTKTLGASYTPGEFRGQSVSTRGGLEACFFVRGA